MVKDDKYSDKEFESEYDMHLYWAENHMDDLNSHDKEKAKKALRKKKEKKDAKMQWRKKMMMRGVGGIVIVALVYVSAPALVSMFSGGSSVDFSELNLENQPMLGSEDAEITVVEFGDYRCHSCKQFEEQGKPLLSEYIESGDVNFYYIDFPLPNFNPGNLRASTAAQCVYEQDEEQFWNVHSALFDNQGSLTYSDDELLQLARDNTEGLNYTELDSCLGNSETLEQVRNDRNLGSQNGVRATPTVFVNGDRITNWSNLDSIIEDRLNE